MPTTPHDRFEYPPKAYPGWFRNGAIIDAEGVEITQEYDGIADWLQQLEISVTAQVETIDDLPEPNPDVVNPRTGDRRVYIVASEGSLYRDTGDDWEPIISSSMDIEESGTTLGEVSRLNFRDGLDTTVSGLGRETATVDISDDIEPETVNVGLELNVPAFGTTDEANAESANLIYVTGSGTDAAGLYYHDDSGWNHLESGSSGATSISELDIDASKAWGGYDITGVGDIGANSVSADSALSIPVYSGSDPDEGNLWIRSDR